jgi:RNA polymerase-binding transcription factor DksA
MSEIIDTLNHISTTPATTPQHEQTRYSDEDLMEFQELIEKKIEATRSELAYYQDQIKIFADDSESKMTGQESGAGTLEKEYLNQMAARQTQFIKNLENALIRIKNKTYGICRATGRLIPKDRLRAVPHATLSIDGKKQEKLNPVVQ